jgi:2-polyprenyl-3-methyl-5-hydroxy-6-metoxy-1,4-benzoquinol methylase
MIIKDYREFDGIKVFHENIDDNHSDYNAKGLDNLYSQEEKHFWFIARKEFILQSLKPHVDANDKIIEIGAGTGNVARYLQKNGYENISVGEMHLNGLRYAQSYGMSECYQFDLLDAPFENEFDTVCLFDVLEHIPNDVSALQNVNKMLKENGNIVLSIPAHMWLWNRDDAIAGHKIRYTKKELVQKLENNGFEVLNARYFFISITPLLLLRRFLNKDNAAEVRSSEHSKDISMNPLLSKVLLCVSRIENKLNKFLPNWCGGSLFVIARKK